MARLDLAHLPMARLAAVVAALALAGCGGGLKVTEAPSRSAKAEERQAQADAKLEAAAKAQANAEAPEAPARAKAELDLSQAEYYVPPEAAKAIDLEYNEGLPEPSQEQVVAAPPAWKPVVAEAGAASEPQIDDVWPNKGPESGGAVVVIKGKNLQASQVLFGMAPAKIIEARADAVKVAVPEYGPGEVAVVITNRDGAYAVAMHAFRYYR
jgi:outer membrane murein-binding lipoprotein Lpp